MPTPAQQPIKDTDVTQFLEYDTGDLHGPKARLWWVSAHEAAIVLQVPLRAVRNMQRRGQLLNIRPGRLRGISVRQLAAQVADRPVALAVLTAITEGRLVAERLDLDESPQSLIEMWRRIK